MIDKHLWDITLNIVDKKYDPKKLGSIESYSLLVYYHILVDYKINPGNYTEIIKEIRKEKLNKLNVL